MSRYGGPLYQTCAVVTAVITYIGGALITGWLMSPVLSHAPDATRIGLVAGASTLAGMVASRWVTSHFLPRSSGVVITAFFGILTCCVYGYSWLKFGEMPAFISTLQCVLLIGLASGLFLKPSFRR